MKRFHLLPALHALPRLLVTSLGAVILLAALVGYAPRPASAAASHPDSCTVCCMHSFPASSFPGNLDGDGFLLDDSITNNDPNAVVFVTNNLVGSYWSPHPLGVWYNSWAKQWAVFNEDTSPMLSGVGFNVLTVHP